MENIKTTKQKRTFKWCNHKWPNTSYQRETKNNHEIILTIDGNETFSSSSGGIAKVCKACKLFDPLYQTYDESIEGPSHINGSKRIYFIFVTAKLLPFMKAYGSTAFNELITSDHKGLYIDISREGILKRLQTNPTSPITRNVQSNNPQAIRKYKRKLEIIINKFNIKKKTLIYILPYLFKVIWQAAAQD